MQNLQVGKKKYLFIIKTPKSSTGNVAPSLGRSWELPHLTKASCSCTLLIFILPVFPLQSGRLQTFNSSPLPELLSKQTVIKSIPQSWLNPGLYL